MTDWCHELCRHFGIGSDYRGFDGQRVSVTPETRMAVLAAMGHSVGSEAEAHALVEQLRHEDSLHPACAEIIVETGKSATIKTSRPVDWAIEVEGNPEPLADGLATDRIDLPPLPMGIHRLVLSDGSSDWVTWILARPQHAVCVAERTKAPRVWGVTTALYGLTDAGKAQIGSYNLLGSYGAAMAHHGADFVGINPVHAMGRTRPDDVISPYSPSHRAFLNTWHTGTVEHGKGSSTDRVDYPAALDANERALKTSFMRFRGLPDDAPEQRAFAAFDRAGGAALDDYALFEVLADRFGPDWRDWPSAFKTRDTTAITAVQSEEQVALSFLKWGQWQADCQIGQAQKQLLSAGMRIGLYLDLAVGPRLGGAETWAKDSPQVTGATLGAPPDPLSPAGQSWGLAPLSPVTCRAQGYAGFARLLRSVMRHAGMIRIDHVIGLMRSFWIPDGATEGAYVSYPLDALLAVVAIESQRSGTIVIGEDLGLVPEGLREKLAGSGIYGMEILQFLRDDAGGFKDTAHIRKKAICAFATHDTPTIKGFFSAEDARLQADIGALDTTRYEIIRADRTAAQQTLGPVAEVPEIHHRLATAGSEMVAVQLDDIAGRVSQQNLPGTINEHPNWQQVAPLAIQDIETSPDFAQLGADMAQQGRANTGKPEKNHGQSDCSNLAH
ncbi:4-alpha-glucanotransferase [Alisedimentitalea sp. MJ-SS2]|uniref:4-alpha-glucanotransferase n=1 Tax=Aliisedimentitalea sp. MJ-SS2 TaxID=3049795 RepID=UPI00290737CD|nr:4-alpha-glucanotransferase [Alisedimentitalea sp. MJ-SS2]MDU8928619.1 4-alpha-glucanotransferase [Alisedimentitalea sp. MJ-SS2]